MGTITIRNLPDNVHNALKTLASKHQRSAEAEVRAILAAAVAPEIGEGFGQQLRKRWAGVYGNEFEGLRDETPPEGANFE